MAEQGKPGGILVLDKPLGWSSMRAVAVVRRRAGGIRTGHAGTLDPLATGVLVLALGPATRLIERLMATEKRYRTVVDLSAFTTTDDREGERTEVSPGRPPPEAAIEEAVASFVGTHPQRPPAFSAMKVGGRRAYRLARGGQPPVLPERPATAHALEVIRYQWPEVELAVRCAKGFYVRSLARALGERLGTGGHCASLRRTAVGPFDEPMARRIEELPDPIGQIDLMAAEEAIAMVARESG